MIDAEVIARIAERKIQEAVEEGKFDNLPGKGKPLVFDEDSTTPAHLRMANKVLKNAGVLPDWMQLQKDIVEERQEATNQRARLIRENQKRLARVSSLPAEHPLFAQYTEWHAKSRTAYLRRLKSVNNSILKFCLIAPSTVEPCIPYKIDAEMAAFDAEFQGADSQQAAEIAEAEDRNSKLQNLARERYQQGAGGGPLRGWLKTAGMRERSDNTPSQELQAGENGGTGERKPGV